MMLAACNGHDSVVKLLVEHNAHVNAQNKVRPQMYSQHYHVLSF